MESLQQLFNNDNPWITLALKAGAIILILLLCMIISKVIKRSIKKSSEEKKKLDPTLVPVMNSLATALTYLVGLVCILSILQIDPAGIVALVGAAGIAVGFALKDTLSNIAAGVMLLMLRPFRKGEAVEFGGTSGVVQEVRLFTTSLETFDGLAVTCPNNSVWSSNITNFSRNGTRRMNLVVGIAYGDSIEKGLEVLRDIARTESRFLSDPATEVMVVEMADSSVNLQLRGWSSVDDYWGIIWDLNKKIKEEIEAAGLTIPFPQRDLHIINHGTEA